MTWLERMFSPEILDWLRETSRGDRYTRQLPADPFASSMRDLDDVAPHLHAIRNSSGGVPRQRITDLRAAKLVERDGSLSGLGERTLAGWEKFGLDNSDYRNELPRQLVLIFEALGGPVEPFYRGLAEFWDEQFAKYGTENIISGWEATYALTYLGWARNGCSPPLALSPPSGDELSEWDAAEFTKLAVLAAPGDDDVRLGAERVSRAVTDSASRGKARKLFLMAFALSRASQDEAIASLSRWTAPASSSSRPHVPIDADIQALCLQIMGDYAAPPEGSGNVYIDLLRKRKNVVFYGPPGTGKTYHALSIVEYWKGRYGMDTVFQITFHPAYSYEDFVWGWRPDADSGSGFSAKEGVLLEAARRAADGTPVLLVIDEINRADTARVFGELITYLEADKRDIAFRLAQDPTSERSIPSSLHVLGTMNSADRSISLMDIALRRRFAFVEFSWDADAYSTHEKWANEVGDISVGAILTALNKRLEAIGIEPDRALGHAMLGIPSDSPNPVLELADRFRFDVYPLVADYCFADRSRIEQVLSPLVGADGRLSASDPDQFISAWRAMAHEGEPIRQAKLGSERVDVGIPAA